MTDASFTKPFMFVSDLVKAVALLEEENAGKAYPTAKKERYYDGKQIWAAVKATKKAKE